MLKAINRLPVSQRLTQARNLRTPFFILKYQLTASPLSRAGVVISKKVSPRASKRNRLKRLVHTALAEALPIWKTPLDVLIILQPAASSSSEETVMHSLKESLAKLS